jgi:glucose/arabinose dehydrogenase
MDASNGRFSRNFPISVVDKAEVASDSSASTFDGRKLHREGILPDLHQRIRDIRQGPDGLLYLVTVEPVPDSRRAFHPA